MHSCVLSDLDYCNAVYGSLSEANLAMLQKIQDSAVRFIFNIYTYMVTKELSSTVTLTFQHKNINKRLQNIKWTPCATQNLGIFYFMNKNSFPHFCTFLDQPA